jgi:tetratricopeptide (TPR) repeat protein
MRLFVIRPFGKKEGIDFDRVDSELIQPAVAALEQYGFAVAGGTTGSISRQGNIREDMFRLIVASDLVIADVSIHNANAFYELGIRHALRPQHTFLMRSKTDAAYPFDLQTDRYFLYDAANPHASIDELVRALRSTLNSVERDSPVFALLPKLVPHGRGQLVRVPQDFQEDVARAVASGRRGDLRLFAHEVGSFEWDQEGLRLIGDAQVKLGAFAGARNTFESLRNTAPDDVQANLRLGTIYQRLALIEAKERKKDLLTQSDQAIQRVIDGGPSRGDRVEAYCLLGSNEKSRWIEDFTAASPDRRLAAALPSPQFKRMLDWYLKAASLDLNAHYPAVNALALLRLQIAFARAAPAVWQQAFPNNEDAEAAVKASETLAARLSCSLCLALQMDKMMGRRDGPSDPWAATSRADLSLLTDGDRPQFVMDQYAVALAGADRFTLEAARRNLTIFKELNQFEPVVTQVLQVIDHLIASGEQPSVVPSRVILFTGHMIDKPGTAKEDIRFPLTANAEAKARAMIQEAVQKELSGHEGSTLGIAGGACGGDILFHEVCEELGVKTELDLALPEDKFQVTSVQRGGGNWIERYQKLISRKVPTVLQQDEALPRWLADKADYDVWRRNNLWMMFNALATGSRQLTLISLFNREPDAQGPGGTRHLTEEAAKWGFKIVELDAQQLLTA